MPETSGSLKPLSWPPALDALIAAPEQHTLLFENDKVRVLDTRIAPGARTPVHTHRWPAVHHVISWSAFVRRDDRNAVLVDTRMTGTTAAPGAVLWGEPLAAHSLENVGTELLHIVSIEIKQDAHS
jgi:quercetin dioxygenase-like cupin family protein